MKLDELHDRLVRAARSIPPDGRVPYAFEKRVLARLREKRLPDQWGLWASGLWRAAAPCLVVCILLLGWSLLVPDYTASGNEDFTQAFENTVLVAADPGPAPDSTW